MLDQFIGATILYPIAIIVFLGVTEIGYFVGRRSRGASNRAEDVGTLAASSLGLLALLLAFSLAHALSRYDARRDLVVEEANAIDSTARLAAMLPERAQAPITGLLRDYAEVRIGLGVPYDLAKLGRDVAKSQELLNGLWRHAVAVSEPQSLPAHRFINALDEMTKTQERRLIAYGYHVPNAGLLMLLGVAIVALGFTGYQAGLTESRLRPANLIMACTVAIVIVLVIDFDQPARGLIEVSPQALIDVAKGLQP
jgi:hypothetical protein